ncbi:MAG: hypothetical protein LBJ03_02600 [Holosporales bacterium]|jgi:hypothetical protein|nr:hypothetical protein [Holosporales bacterium]
MKDCNDSVYLKKLLTSGAVLANCLGCCAVGVVGLSLTANETLAARPGVRQLVQDCYPNGDMIRYGEYIVQLYEGLDPERQALLKRWLQDDDNLMASGANKTPEELASVMNRTNPMIKSYVLNLADDAVRQRLLAACGVQNLEDRNRIIGEAADGYRLDNGSIQLSGKAVTILMSDYGLDQDKAEEIQALLTVPDERRDHNAMRNLDFGGDIGRCIWYLSRSSKDRKRMVEL